MDLPRPQVLNIGKHFTASVPVLIEYTEPFSNVMLKRKVSTLFVSEEELNKIGEPVQIAVDTHPPSREQLSRFFAMQTLIKVCSDNAEDVKNRLLGANLQIGPLDQAQKEQLMQMDLMKLKERFIEFLKKDQLIKAID